jgi:pimeloyl-ACP methyl ester carboxylesterase
MPSSRVLPAVAAAAFLGACATSPMQTAGAPGAPPAARATDSVRLETATGTLHGTLELPAGARPVPVVLIIAGSGPTDRDGNSRLLPGPNNGLRQLAESLAARGIASVRYDKRGTGASAAAGRSEADLRFDHLVDDAAGWLGQLRADPRFSSLAVIGHSEGSLIGMLAAARAGADGAVSLAGSGRRASDLIRGQLAGQLPPALRERSDAILAGLEAGRTTDSVPPPLLVLYRPSVQPYLVSWFRHDPAEAVRSLAVPVLVAQGTHDIQVDTAEARRLVSARPGVELLLVPGMNHVLKITPADRAAQLPSYGDPSLPVPGQLVEGIASFVRRLEPRSGRPSGN